MRFSFLCLEQSFMEISSGGGIVRKSIWSRLFRRKHDDCRAVPILLLGASLTLAWSASGQPAAAYPTGVLAANPVGYWRLNETNNTASGAVVAMDATGNHNGIYGTNSADGVSGPTPSAGFPGFESTNTAAEFTNGLAHSFITLPALNLNTNTVTITAWIYPKGTVANYASIVMCRNAPNTDACGLDFRLGGQLGYVWNQGNLNTGNWNSGLYPPVGQWSFVALVVSPNSAVTYLCNAAGVFSATNRIAHNVEVFTANTLIGGDTADGGNGARTLNGIIDEVAVFNYSLTAGQISNLYVSSSAGPPQVGATIASPSSSVVVGATVTLSAAVQGLGPLDYQWQSNGVNLAGATSSTLVLTNVQLAYGGSYDVLVGNSYGTNQSSSVVITVNPAGPPPWYPPYATAVLAANPVGYWRLNETNNTASGTVVAADVTGNHNGTYGVNSADGVRGPTLSAGFPGFESTNSAAEFTNALAHSFITLPALNLNTNTVTITAWIYPKGTVANYASIAMCRNAPNTDACGLDFRLGGQLGYVWNQGNLNTGNWNSGLYPPVGQWSFVALVVSPNSAVTYLCNAAGVFSATNRIAHNVEVFTANTLIGGDTADGGNGARTLNGIIDEVAVFNYSLTAGQISNLYLNASASAPQVGATIASPSNSVFAGTTVTLSAAVQGLGPLKYQWQFNGANLAGATSSTLVLTDAQVVNSGNYDLLVGNSYGTNQSSLLSLAVNPYSAYPTAILAASPVGYWRLNETSNTASGTVVAVDVTGNHNGIYGTNSADGVPGPTPSAGFPGFESTNTAAELTNGLAHSFITLPALNLNTNTVTITAWIYPKGTVSNYSSILMCRNAPNTDACGLDFRVGGELGYVWNQGSLNTGNWNSGLYPPVGQWSFVALVVSPNSAITYLCDAAGEFSATNPIAHDVEVFTANTLIGGDTADGGNGARTLNGIIDEVAVFNYSLTQKQIFDLYFSGAVKGPEVGATTASPSNNVFAGTTVTLGATVLGLGPFQYQWQSNGINLAGATSSTFVLTDAQSADSATYDVAVANNYATNQSSPVVLTVNPPGAPQFSQQPSPASATNYVGGLVTFTGTVNGSPPIALEWLHNGSIVSNATTATLTLAGLQLNAAGTYTLIASNYLGMTTSAPVTLTVLPIPNPSALNVLTYHNDNARDGANTNEFVLTPQNVNVTNFGLLFSYPVDEFVVAEPLYVSGLVIPGQGTHNVVFVATENNTVYAFDADSNTGPNGGLLWQTNLGIAALFKYHEFGGRYGTNSVQPASGITGTPVINLANGTLYVNVHTRIANASSTNYYHWIHALNITNGAEQPYSPVAITNSVPGKGVGSSNGVVTFNARQQAQRPGLTLAGGMLYVAYGSYADTDPYHGWIIGLNATNLQASAQYCFNTSPNATVANFGGNAGEAALWMGGNGLCVDSSNNLFFLTGNGSFSANTNGIDYGDSFMRLSTTNGLKVADYFTPYNQAQMSAGDVDLGSGGPLLLPDSVGSAAHPHLAVGAGKDGNVYLVDRDKMGHFNAINNNQVVQELPDAITGAWSTPAYFNRHIYYQGSGDVMKAFSISNAVLSTAPTSKANTSFSANGGTPFVSANGTNNGIVWTLQSDAFATGGPAILHAYNATNLALELYNTGQNLARDNPGGAIEMTTPTVVNGKVFVGAQYALSVYGNGLFLPTPSISPDGGLFTNSVMVSLADAAPNASIYYTLDGTLPTTNSILYTGPFLLKNSALVQAIAAEFGAVNSGLASASFADSSAVGNGTGLLGEYWANTGSKAFTNITFSASPTLTRTDAVINFNWSVAGPSPAVGQTNFAVLWQGSIQPEYGETYTFTTIAQDGVELWVNGQLLVSDWATNTITQTNSGSITLAAQELYNIEMKYFQSTGPAMAELLWSSPSTAQAIVPQTQLYPFTNPPPSVALIAPANNATYTASASVTLSANAAAEYNPLTAVAFYLGNVLLGTVSNAPYTLTTTGLGAGSYSLTAVAVDGSGLSATSAPVNITVNPGTGLPYGLTNLVSAPAFYNMPSTYYSGTIPTLLSQTGIFTNTPSMTPLASLIPYAPNVQLFSDNAQKIRYFSVPNTGAPLTASEQITYAPTNNWSFPAGTVFVKTFELQTNTSDPTSLLRLETRLLVLDTNGAVYGVTYKWRSDYSDADLLSSSQTEAIPIQTPGGVYTNLWYYPSPSDCLQCHTAVANYVLGANARQLNRTQTYSNGVTDNELRALNRAGLFNPAIDEASITNIEALSALTNLSASYQQRARSYLDANCAQCHQPGGTGPTFDARYDTPLAQQNIIGVPAVKGNLGYDNVDIVTPEDVWRSSMYDRINSLDPSIQMPPLARYLIDTNAVEVMADWINSLPGTPALPPPTIVPAGGTFEGSVSVTLEEASNNAAIYYTLDGSLPTTNSMLYTGPFLLTNTVTVNANAWETGYSNSVAASSLFNIVSQMKIFLSSRLLQDRTFEIQHWAPVGRTYIVEASVDLQHWVPVSTNNPGSAPFDWVDKEATNATTRFYRVVLP